MQDTHLHLISFDICPYVERSRIVLEEKDLDYDITFIDLSDKPEWFLEISPRGKVPVLLADDRPIFESMVINEYLEDAFPEPSMFPDDPIEPAVARAWIVYANDVIMPPFGELTYAAETQEDIDRAREELREAFEKLDSELAVHDGEFFLSDEFGLVDAVYTPIWSRMEALDILGYEDIHVGLDRFEAYGGRLLDRPATKAARAEHLTDKTVEANT